MPERKADVRFVADRMLGTLTRYLRFLGYDTLSANSIARGSSREDTLLLHIAKADGRVLLTRDRELARRGGTSAVLLESEDVIEQLSQLIESGIMPAPGSLRLQRCSLCNTPLRSATPREIASAEYAPKPQSGRDFAWCPVCRKLYWLGSHADHLAGRLARVRKKEG
ncbi:MAG: hypothetical protein GKC04_04345 [Methanomicrobiales archaeon]|nr:hypothetical protein [Methanomicrobiales archaeon]